jgi:hypothetical protein
MPSAFKATMGLLRWCEQLEAMGIAKAPSRNGCNNWKGASKWCHDGRNTHQTVVQWVAWWLWDAVSGLGAVERWSLVSGSSVSGLCRLRLLGGDMTQELNNLP